MHVDLRSDSGFRCVWGKKQNTDLLLLSTQALTERLSYMWVLGVCRHLTNPYLCYLDFKHNLSCASIWEKMSLSLCMLKYMTVSQVCVRACVVQWT